ncbi:unnamed protein product [Pleuronectes platessa]|uniref:Threonine synthase-like 2 n=1 Tax=Pleuronectes platessa TaxID=8262 RepID=A0A9N7U628_PLEPL|nr:unnamed protein product [Pleuronectes platessa]
MIQLAHFLYAYLELSGAGQSEAGAALPELEVVVPTGGAGNIAAGLLVKRMGVPLKLVAMVNSNDVVHRAVTEGDFSMAANVTQTLAPAIDIQDPYNMERVFWLLLDRDGASVKIMMEEFQNTHKYSLPENHRKLLSQVLSTGTVSDDGILETMRRCWDENQYVLCPHSAVAVWQHYHCPPRPGINRCYIATASPAKFQAAVQRAGLTFDLPEAVQALDKLPTRYQILERSPDWCKDWEQTLREKIQALRLLSVSSQEGTGRTTRDRLGQTGRPGGTGRTEPGFPVCEGGTRRSERTRQQQRGRGRRECSGFDCFTCPLTCLQAEATSHRSSLAPHSFTLS